MQNQKFWDDTYAATGYSEDCWAVDRQTNNDDLSSFSLTSGVGSANAPYNEFLSYSPANSSLTKTVPEGMHQSISSQKILPCLDSITEISHGINESSDELLELNPKKFSKCCSEQTKGRSLSSSQHFSSGLFNKTPFLTNRSRPKIEERRLSLPSDSLDVGRLLSAESDLSHDSHDSDASEVTSYISSCDIALGNSNDSLSKVTSWSNCYAPYRKHPASSVSSERAIDSLINKLFTGDQKKRYLSLKKKSRKMEERKERLKCMGIDASFKVFMKDGISSSQGAPKSQNKDDELSGLSPKRSSELEMFQNKTTASPSANSDASSRLSNFFTELSSSSPTYASNDVTNQSEVLSVDKKVSNTRIVPEAVPFQTDAANRTYEVVIENTKKQLSAIDMDRGVNISIANFSNDEISDSLEKIFTVSNATDDSAMYDMKQEQTQEIDFDFEKLASPHEECLEVPIKETEQVVIVSETAVEGSLGLDTETSFQKDVSSSIELRTCPEVTISNNNPECSSGLESDIELHSSLPDFPANVANDNVKVFTEENRIGNTPVEYSVCSDNLEPQLQHSSLSNLTPNDEERNTIEGFAVENQITDPPIEFTVTLESNKSVSEIEDATNPIHDSVCLDTELGSKDNTVAFVNIAVSEKYDMVNLEESTTANDSVNFMEIQENELYYEEQKELILHVNDPDSFENKLNSEENSSAINAVEDNSETCGNYLSLKNHAELMSEAYLHALKASSNMADSEMLDISVTECKVQNSNNLSDENRICTSENVSNPEEEQFMEIDSIPYSITNSETCTNFINIEGNKEIVSESYLAVKTNSNLVESKKLDSPIAECGIQSVLEDNQVTCISDSVSNAEEQCIEFNNKCGSITDSVQEKDIRKEMSTLPEESEGASFRKTLPGEPSHALNEQEQILHKFERSCVKIVSKARKSFGSKPPSQVQEEEMQLDVIDNIRPCDKPDENVSFSNGQGLINKAGSTRIFINDEIECTLVEKSDNQKNILEEGTGELFNAVEDTLEIKPSQKSRKSFPPKNNSDFSHRSETARKSIGGSNPGSSHPISRGDSDSSSGDDSDSILPKRRKLMEYLCQVSSGAENSSAAPLKTSYGARIAKTALKTFVKPFTVAKKSATKKSAYESILQAYFGVKTAMKTVNKSPNPKIQKENIIENDGSAIVVSLTNQNEAELSVDELSADESKNSPESWSPLKDLMPLKSVCCCSADMVPCLCNGEKLQLTCEAEDSIDGQMIACMKNVTQQFLLTPSSEIKHKIFCDRHLWRLAQHQCCPKCGVFCTQGSFLLCSFAHLEGESHFFHTDCLLVPGAGLPPSCPHCCRFSDFKTVRLALSEAQNSSQDKSGKSDAKNITSELEKYAIFMEAVTAESEKPANGSLGSVSQKQELQSMVMAIASEKSLHLRPSGKCLFNPIKNGDVKKVLQLIVNGVNPNHKFKTHKNNTPLHIGAYYGFPGIVHVLLQYGALIDAVNDDLETPLILAVEKNQLTVVRYLTFAGAQIDVKNENGLTAFHVASKNGSREIAEFLYSTGNFNVNIQDEGGWTPLVWACENNYADYIKWLLELGADPNVRDNEENTALHWAACTGDSEILVMLLDSGCNLTFVNQRGDSALHIAARKDNCTCVKLLLKRGALFDCKNKEGETPILCCDDGSKSLRILKRHLSNVLKMEKISLLQNVVYRDVSRGSEAYPIQAVNEVDEEEFIMDFRYITNNCYSPDLRIVSTVDSMQVCYCRDNCSSRNCTCSRISKCWYDMTGHLLSDFDLNDPPTIFECNKTCHCPKTCINRVVQKGLKIPLQLFRTFSMGWGVRTLKQVPKGTFVCEYVGEVLTGKEIAERTDDNYLFDLESKTGDVCLDGCFYGNVARFINHSCEPNLVSVRVFIEHQDLNFPRIAFFTMRNVEAFEELCFDYGLEFWIAKSQTVLCTCNTSSCKYSKDSIDDTLQSYVDQKDIELSGLDT